MSKWDMVRLGDVCNIIMGQSPSSKTYNDKGIGLPFYQGKTDFGLFFPVARMYCDKPHKKTHQNDVLMSVRAPVGSVNIATETCCIGRGISALSPKPNYLDYKFLFYYCRAVEKNIEKMGVGSTFKAISRKDIDSLLLPLPPLDEQRRIAESLDLASSLIEKRKKQIELLDLLAKSLFVEMFGDPVENPMGWEVVQLKDITTKIGSGATPRGGKESYKTEGIHLIRSMNVHNGRFKLLDLAFIDEKQASQLDNVVVEKDDVLINITGASVARSCIVPDNILPARVNQHVSIIRLNKKFANSQFINNVFVNINYQQKLLSLSNAGGATREAITKSQLEKLETILPPVDLQIQFANVIEAIETQKSLLQNGLEKLEMNSKALMQKYFEET